jgi:hypothetical protein
MIRRIRPEYLQWHFRKGVTLDRTVDLLKKPMFSAPIELCGDRSVSVATKLIGMLIARVMDENRPINAMMRL